MPVVYDLQSHFEDGDNQNPFKKRKSNIKGYSIPDIDAKQSLNYEIYLQP